jgi:hypothetical protein
MTDRVTRTIRQPRAGLAQLYALLALLAASASVDAQVLTQIRDSGPRANRINVVILSEGYTSDELTSKFASDAERIMNGMLEAEPWSEYRDYFNFFTIAVASRESGSDHPSRGISRDTYFNSSFDTYGVPRILTIPPNSFITNFEEGEGKVSKLLAQFVPDYDLVLLLVNDPEYGGTGGGTAIVSMHELAVPTAIHEMGHSFAYLGDEYDADTPGFPKAERPNVTQQTSRDLIRWHNWILPSTPIPTPETFNPQTNRPYYEQEVGLFEGANYSAAGWYRPKFTCRMNANVFPFCEVCAEALTLNIYRRVSPVDGATPQVRKLNIPLEQSATFTVTRLQPTTHALSVQWFLDDVAVPGATGDSFVVSAANAPEGYHTVRADVWDSTPLVRDDPQHILKKSERWEVWVGPTMPGPAPVLNVSTRLPVQTGDQVLIGGFIITGSEPKRVILRAIGPSIAGPGAAEILPVVPIPFLKDPTLELFDSSGVRLQANDDWKTTQEEEIKATRIPPSDDRESAIVTTLNPGAYTAKVVGKNNTSGIALVEVYDLAQGVGAQLANISTRGVVQTGYNVMIGGFIVGSADSGQTRVIVRAVGPSLAKAGVSGTLSDPMLELRDGQGQIVRANDNWRDSQEEEIAGTGVQPADPREAAIVATLPSGPYTAIVSGKSGAIGIGLFELYNLGQ